MDDTAPFESAAAYWEYTDWDESSCLASLPTTIESLLTDFPDCPSHARAVSWSSARKKGRSQVEFNVSRSIKVLLDNRRPYPPKPFPGASEEIQTAYSRAYNIVQKQRTKIRKKMTDLLEEENENEPQEQLDPDVAAMLYTTHVQLQQQHVQQQQQLLQQQQQLLQQQQRLFHQQFDALDQRNTQVLFELVRSPARRTPTRNVAPMDSRSRNLSQALSEAQIATSSNRTTGAPENLRGRNEPLTRNSSANANSYTRGVLNPPENLPPQMLTGNSADNVANNAMRRRRSGLQNRSVIGFEAFDTPITGNGPPNPGTTGGFTGIADVEALVRSLRTNPPALNPSSNPSTEGNPATEPTDPSNRPNALRRNVRPRADDAAASSRNVRSRTGEN